MQFSLFASQSAILSYQQNKNKDQAIQRGFHYLANECRLLLKQAEFFIVDNDLDISKQKAYTSKNKKLLIFDYLQVSEKYQRVGQFNIDQQTSAIQIKFYLLLNGVLVSLGNDIHKQMYLRLQTKINAMNTTFTLVISNRQNNIYLLNKQLIRQNIQIYYRNPNQMLNFTDFVVNSTKKFRQDFKIILYLLNQGQTKNLLNIPELNDLFTDIVKHQQQLQKVQKSLFQGLLNLSLYQEQKSPELQHLVFNQTVPINQSYFQKEMLQKNNLQQTKININLLNQKIIQQLKYKIKKTTKTKKTTKQMYQSNEIERCLLKEYNFFSKEFQNALQIIKPGSSKIKLNLYDNILIAYSKIDRMKQQEQKQGRFPNKVFQNIQIITPMSKIQWKDLTKGGYGSLEFAQVKFKINQIKQQSNQSIKVGNLVRKSNKNKDQSDKILHEKKVLFLLSQVQSFNIKTYFESKQPQYSGYLFSKYQPFSSLDVYASKNGQTFSLLQKLRLLVHACNGIRTLHQKNIVHLDIKPGNIIITQNMVGKVIDFGEAYILGQNPTMYNYARTIPYAAPEVVGMNTDFSFKADVYSIGVMIFRVIFGKHIFNINDKNQFQLDLIQDRIRILVVPQAYMFSGFEKVNRILVQLCLMCIQRNTQKRPTLHWLHNYVYGVCA